MYQLNFKETFQKGYQRYIQKNPALFESIEKTLSLLITNPFYKGIRTHKVESKNYGRVFSSRVTGDLRILWDFYNGKAEVIEILDMGGHSGKSQVYKTSS